MGFFGGDNDEDSQPSPADQLAQQQIQQNQNELNQKRDALFQDRLNIVRSQGTDDYNGSNKNAPIMGK